MTMETRVCRKDLKLFYYNAIVVLVDFQSMLGFTGLI